MKCDVCGLEYGVSHNCPGSVASTIQALEQAEMQRPAEAGLGYYLGEALKIVRWDDAAVRRNAKDGRAIFYGVIFWCLSALVILLASVPGQMRARLPHAQPTVLAITIVIGLVFGFVLLLIVTFTQLGLCHLIAKWFLGGTGKFMELLRPLLLGWFVNILVLIPVVGNVASAIAWTAVLMLVFEEVEGIERMQAFGISAGINICFFVLQFMLLPGSHL